MPVTVLIKETGEEVKGKFAAIDIEKIGLFSGIMSDKKGGFRGCGRKTVFDASVVTVIADEPDKELKQR